MLPLTVMLLRVYRMEESASVRYLPEYGGCTSWVGILHDVQLGRLEPVLTDEKTGGVVIRALVPLPETQAPSGSDQGEAA